MLDAHDATRRLRVAIDLMSRMGQLQCGRCRSHVASTEDTIGMTDEGTAGTFVNSYGWVSGEPPMRYASNPGLPGCILLNRSSPNWSLSPRRVPLTDCVPVPSRSPLLDTSALGPNAQGLLTHPHVGLRLPRVSCWFVSKHTCC